MSNLILKLGEFIWFFGWGLLGGYEFLSAAKV